MRLSEASDHRQLSGNSAATLTAFGVQTNAHIDVDTDARINQGFTSGIGVTVRVGGTCARPDARRYLT